MKLCKLLVIITITGLTTFLQAAGDDKQIIGTINAANLNIRVKPNTKFTAVAKLKYGEQVEIVRQDGDWYEIIAPKNSSVWVSAGFIKDNTTTRKVNLRSGPGINYQSYGIIPAGQKITILSNLSSAWTKIAPTPGLTAWAFAKYVKLSPAALAKLNTSTTLPATKPPVKVKPHDIKLPFIAGFAQTVEYSGTLWKLKEQDKYVSHVLVKIHNGKAKPLCFIRIEAPNIDQWNNKVVKISGIKKLVKAWKLPVVIVKATAITALNNSTQKKKTMHL